MWHSLIKQSRLTKCVLWRERTDIETIFKRRVSHRVFEVKTLVITHDRKPVSDLDNITTVITDSSIVKRLWENRAPIIKLKFQFMLN